MEAIMKPNQLENSFSFWNHQQTKEGLSLWDRRKALVWRRTHRQRWQGTPRKIRSQRPLPVRLWP